MKVRRAKTLAVATTALLLAALPCRAGGSGALYEVKFGVLAHDVSHLWSGFRLESGIGLNGEAIFRPALAFLGGHVRTAAGGTLTLQDDGRIDRGTSKAYAGIRWMYESPRGVFASLGIGGALHNGLLDPTDPERKALGRRVLLHFPFEVGVRLDAHHSVSLYFDHISNGYTKPMNEGLDTLGLRYSYKF